MVIKKKIDELLQKKEIKAKEMLEILKLAKWIMREPPKNQPHFSKKNISCYVVVDLRYGLNTIQRFDLARKYLKRIKENL